MTEKSTLEHFDAPGSTVYEIDPAANDEPIKIIVIGNGPVGVRFTQEILKRRPNLSLCLFGNEAVQPYNRVQLSALLAGEVKYEDIVTLLPSAKNHRGFSHVTSAITKINIENKYVTDARGTHYAYDKLVIATGSRPHIPNIPGVDQTGVFTFRNIKDTEFLYARIARARHVVVVGGGLLGLEAARGLQKANTRITLIQQGTRLMNRQLDDDAARLLQKKVEALGIRVITNSGVRMIHGEGRVTGVTTRDGDEIVCDTVLLCAGIKANIELARDAWIKVGRGIIVDDQLATSAPDVFAIGECCEHRGLTYGLVNPGFEQAAIAAEIIANGQARYQGSLEVSRLKVLGEDVCSMGDVADLIERPRQIELKYHRGKKSLYRKLVIHKGRLTGAVGFGKWDEVRRIQEAYQHGRRIWFWQQFRFLLTGNVWSGNGEKNIKNWPNSTVICQCNNISHGELIQAMEGGASTPLQLQRETGAGSVCGSCKPLLEQLTGHFGPQEKDIAWLPVLIASTVAVFVAASIALLPELNVSDSVKTSTFLETLWNNKTWKQITGFTLLGLSATAVVLAMRKRIRKFRFGQFSYWRAAHVVLGTACAVVLIAHTGLHVGDNLNRILMFNFLSVLLLGSVAGLIVSNSHFFSGTRAMELRKFSNWIHILVAWPLPVLLGMHILTVYYF